MEINDYDVGQIMQEIEVDLIKSMRRNLGGHLAWEQNEGFKWEQWQAKKIREIRKFKNQNAEIMASYTKKLNKATKSDLRRQFLEGGHKADKEVANALEKGMKLIRGTPSDDFFQGDNAKLQRLINAVNKDFKQAQIAALRQMDDVYRKTIFKTEVFLGSGATTLDKAIDMATKDFLAKGINCITYADGRQVNIASYAQMAVRAANKRVFLMGEGERRKEWGVSLVLVSQYMQSSPTCQPWQGKVYIDDVYSGGSADDGDYPLLSQAIEGGLFHPNCRHAMSTFFPEVNEEPEPMHEEEIGEAYEKAQRETAINRNVQKYKRLKEGSLDPENVRKYGAKLREWQMRAKFFKGQTVKPIAKAVPDGIINNKDWLVSEFSSAKKYRRHIEKHLHQYKNMTEADYMKRAQELLAADLSEDIEGFVTDEGFIFKYSKSTNDFAIGRADGKISTLFKPDEKYEYWKGERLKYEPKN